MSNEINSNKIYDKFDGFYNDINVIKIKIAHEMKQFFLTWIQITFKDEMKYYFYPIQSWAK